MSPPALYRRHHFAGVRGCLLILIAGHRPVWPIDIKVDILGDPEPNDCTPGHCSLREAVTLADSLTGPDRMLLPATIWRSSVSVTETALGVDGHPIRLTLLDPAPYDIVLVRLRHRRLAATSRPVRNLPSAS